MLLKSCVLPPKYSALLVFKQLNLGKNSVLLQSSKAGWFDGQCSLIALLPFARFQSKHKISRFEDFSAGATQTTLQTKAPLAHLQSWLERFDMSGAPSLSEETTAGAFHGGGVIGYFAYDFVHHVETITKHKGQNTLPDIDLFFFNCYIRLPHDQNTAEISYNPEPLIRLGWHPEQVRQQGKKILKELARQLKLADKTSPTLHDPTKKTKTQIQCDWTKKNYKGGVRAIKDHITAGDIFQANLSQRFSLPAQGRNLLQTYEQLWTINPSPFACYLNFGTVEIASASPELLFRINKTNKGRSIETRPIAGTKPRGQNEAEDKKNLDALYESTKERAEHLMLVDLERNDLGKVCKYGTVSVEELMVLERYSHVMHLVSHISGQLRSDVDPLQALTAVFPGGTITGVPKIRCMDILAGLEKSPRGLYTGAIGVLGFDGTAEFNIAIRTIVREKEEISFQAGGGIVADSDPEHEYQETHHKAAAMMVALGLDASSTMRHQNNQNPPQGKT